MKNHVWMRGLVAGLALTPLAKAQDAAPAPAQGQPPVVEAHKGNDLPGPIDSVQDLQDTGKMLFKLADTNNDGQISQKEAVDAGNLLVGGFFFRADQNGDGTVTKDEARQAREALFQQKPMLRFIAGRAKAAAPAAGGAAGTANPSQALMSFLDTNNDQQIQASELRQSVATAVQGLFAAADTNRDGQMSPSEINAAAVGMAQTAAQAAFQAADSDRDGALSRAEYDKAIIEPANVVFSIFDANNDGKISDQEARSAQNLIANQLRLLQVPEPANSARHMIESGRTPAQSAPVPNIAAPRPAAAPAPGAAPAPR